MQPSRRSLRAALLAAAALTAAAVPVARAQPAPSAPAPSATDARAAAFAEAARAYQVPLPVLLSVSYNETRWEAHSGAASTSGAYGPMALTDLAAADLGSGADRGQSATARATRTAESQPANRTALTAAALTHAAPASVRGAAAANIRAGAALLASYARGLNHGRLPADLAHWYGAVAEYSGSHTSTATDFADAVYATLATGAARRTADGQSITLPAQPAAAVSVPDRSAQTAPLHLTPADSGAPAECPAELHCTFIPAAYAQDDPNDKTNYGNYDTANRPSQMRINQIVIHDTDEPWANTLSDFQNPAHYSSANYVIRSSDGAVVQMVRDKDVAWQAGNWYVNMHSIGIEHEGLATDGKWFTEPQYRSSAALVRYLAACFGVPLDRAHIIGHDNVPGTSAASQPGMHWDPGPYWDWQHYLELLGAPVHPTAPPSSRVVTIDPDFATNQQTLTTCESGTCSTLPRASVNFVHLHTGPSDSAPLISDAATDPKGPGTIRAEDWGDKAVTGQQFVVAGRSGDWTAIWYGGQKAWFDNPPAAPTAVPSRALAITPAGASAPTYGRALPEPSAWPAPLKPRQQTPLGYTLAAGQQYPVYGTAIADFYESQAIDGSLPYDHTDIVGKDVYYLIQLNHRMAYVKATDVRVVAP